MFELNKINIFAFKCVCCFWQESVCQFHSLVLLLHILRTHNMQEAVGTTTANRRPFGWGILGTANIAKTFVKAVQTLNKDQVLRL